MILPRAILIDLDDTIVDDGGTVDGCWRDACTEALTGLPGLALERLLRAIERRRQWYWADVERHLTGRLDLRSATTLVVQHALADLGAGDPAAASRLANRYRDLREERVCVFDGALETLGRLRREGVRLAMVTNGGSAGQRAKIERFQIAPYFAHIQVEEEYGLGKPHLEVYENALRVLGVAPEDAWSVGDNLEWDVGAPQRLGVYGIWVDGAGAGLPEGSPVKPDRIIRALPDLLGDSR